MKSKYTFSIKEVWFAMEVILIFISIEAIAYTFGHFDAGTIALVLLIVAFLLFIAALINARKKDKKHKNHFAI